MDENKTSGAFTELKGNVKDAAGSLAGDSKLQAEGKADKVLGRVQGAYGQAKDEAEAEFATLGQQVDQVMRERPLQALLLAAAFGYALSSLLRRR